MQRRGSSHESSCSGDRAAYIIRESSGGGPCVTWLKIDDKLTTHPKWMQIDAYAESLWLHASVWSASHNTDGVIPEYTLSAHATKVPGALVEATVAALVRARLWKRLPKSRGGGWEIVNWLEYQPSRAQIERKAETDSLHDWLHKTPLGKRVKAAVRRRDRVWCRYCGIEVNTNGDRRSLARLTFDYVDPDFVFDRNTPFSAAELDRVTEAWVVACGYCNAVKNRRSPAESEMPLRPAPALHRDLPRSAANESRAVREPGTGLNGSGQVGAGGWPHLGGSRPQPPAREVVDL